MHKKAVYKRSSFDFHFKVLFNQTFHTSLPQSSLFWRTNTLLMVTFIKLVEISNSPWLIACRLTVADFILKTTYTQPTCHSLWSEACLWSRKIWQLNFCVLVISFVRSLSCAERSFPAFTFLSFPIFQWSDNLIQPFIAPISVCYEQFCTGPGPFSTLSHMKSNPKFTNPCFWAEKSSLIPNIWPITFMRQENFTT